MSQLLSYNKIFFFWRIIFQRKDRNLLCPHQYTQLNDSFVQCIMCLQLIRSTFLHILKIVTVLLLRPLSISYNFFFSSSFFYSSNSEQQIILQCVSVCDMKFSFIELSAICFFESFFFLCSSSFIRSATTRSNILRRVCTVYTLQKFVFLWTCV